MFQGVFSGQLTPSLVAIAADTFVIACHYGGITLNRNLARTFHGACP